MKVSVLSSLMQSQTKKSTILQNRWQQLKEKYFVPVDPGPLSAAYGRLIASQDVKESKWILTIGSVTPTTGRQIHYLVDKTNAKPVYVDAEALASITTSWDNEVERATEEALRKLDTEELTDYYDSFANIESSKLIRNCEKEGTTGEELAKRITVGLANITHNVV